MSTLVNRKYRYDMATPWTVREGETPWNVYPRPQMKRDSFLCLNGKWKIACETKQKTEPATTNEPVPCDEKWERKRPSP